MCVRPVITLQRREWFLISCERHAVESYVVFTFDFNMTNVRTLERRVILAHSIKKCSLIHENVRRIFSVCPDVEPGLCRTNHATNSRFPCSTFQRRILRCRGAHWSNCYPHRWGWTLEWWSVGDTHSVLRARKCVAADTRNYPNVSSSVNVTAADRTQNPPNVILMLYAEPRKSPVLQYVVFSRKPVNNLFKVLR
jgi:hypothetical protein